MEKKRRIIMAVLLMLAIGNYSRLKGNDNIRAIQFVSILVIGVLAGLLISELSQRLKQRAVNRNR